MLKGALGIAPPVMPVMPTSDMDPQHSEPAPHQHH
jgi:hypothetical protein